MRLCWFATPDLPRTCCCICRCDDLTANTDSLPIVITTTTEYMRVAVVIDTT